MSPLLIIVFILVYFGILFAISYITGRGANNESFFIGNRKSHWYLVAMGLIGDSLSGVTFISVPGAVTNAKFSYMQVVFGYFVGYIIINQVLLPLYYRLKLTSIYSFLLQRFGPSSQRTGSFFFLLSRLFGAAGRLYLAVGTIQLFVFDRFHVPFALTVFIMIALMLVYTFKGGIKTLVWTDTFQSLLLLFGLIFSIVAILNHLEVSPGQMISDVRDSEYSRIFFWDWKARNYFWKQFIGGIFIAVAMTGLDQNMMQKNLSCPSLRDAQKNIYSFSVVMLLVNLLFVSLGAMLYIYASRQGITLPMKSADAIDTDKVFPTLALSHLGMAAGLAFIIGLTAATFSSADSVLTTLTTAFCIDFLGFEKPGSGSEKSKTTQRIFVHICFSLLLFAVILLFRRLNSRAIIDTILTLANYTYGPLLGLFAFGLFTRWRVYDIWVPLVCFASPWICYLLDLRSAAWFNGYQFGYELLLVNGLITFTGLLLLVKRKARHA